MKKRFIAAVIIVIILLLLAGLYSLGYIEFHDYLPTFVPNPGTMQSNNSSERGTPQLVIEKIKGRFNKVLAEISNAGDQDAESISWSISVTGGILKRIDLHSTGTLSTLSAQSVTTVMTDRIPLGLGRLQITVTVQASGGEPVTQTARGFKLLFLVLGVRT